MLKETEKITSYDQVQRFIGQMDFENGNTALHYCAEKGKIFLCLKLLAPMLLIGRKYFCFDKQNL